jgi:hypothetical protein
LGEGGEMLAYAFVEHFLQASIAMWQTVDSPARDASKSIDDFRKGKKRSVELRLALGFGDVD